MTARSHTRTRRRNKRRRRPLLRLLEAQRPTQPTDWRREPLGLRLWLDDQRDLGGEGRATRRGSEPTERPAPGAAMPPASVAQEGL